MVGILRLWLAVALLVAGAAPRLRAQEPVDVEPAELIVVLRPGPRSAGEAQRLGRLHGARHVYRAVFDGFAAPLSPRAHADLRNHPLVVRIEPSRAQRLMAEVLPAGVDRVDADRAHAQGHRGAGARVAVLDTGIDLDHPDLRANIDASLSRTLVSTRRTTRSGDDDHGHGTHVAGTIAALAGNGLGVIGMAPAARLVSFKVFDSRGSGRTSDIIAALDAITAHNRAAASYADMIHVANCSFGGGGGDVESAYRLAFEACVGSGCLVVVAAGNSSADAAGTVPAAYDAVLTVSAMSPYTGAFAWFSNHGADVDLAAPGVDILSTIIDGQGSMSGTSMAAPHVAGAAALYVGEHLTTLDRGVAPGQVRAALLGSGEFIALAGDPDGIREPLLDAEAALGPVSPPEPTVTVALTTSDGPTYPADATVARVVCQPRDEGGRPIIGLSSAAFGSRVDGAATSLVFGEAAAGVYEASLALTSLTPDVTHTLTVTVRDDRGVTGSGSTEVRRVTAVSIHVARIGYRTTGPRMRDLLIDLVVQDEDGRAVGGATVDIELSLDGALYASGRGAVTGSDGLVTYRAQRAPSGRYTTEIVAVSKAGSVHDPRRDASDPGFTKP